MISPVHSLPGPAGQTLACFALPQEAGVFQNRIAGRTDVSILLTGVGRQNAGRRIAGRLNQFRPRLVLTCGFAGGLDPALTVGTVLFSTADANWRDKLSTTGAIAGRFFCAPRIATTVAEKCDLRRTTGADAVEMESEAIQDFCRAQGIPCATVRAISDTANESLPLDFNQLSKPDMSLDYGRLAWAVMKAPGKIPALLRLQRNSSLAARRLADVLTAVTSRD